MTYDQWESAQGISPNSPEAYYAELAWNAALRAAKGALWLDMCDPHTERETDLINALITNPEE